MGILIEALLWAYGGVRPLLAQVWKAWDWATGTGSALLAWVLWLPAFSLALHQRVGRPVGMAMMAFVGVWTLWILRQMAAREPGEVLPAEVAATRQTLGVLAGYWVLVVLVDLGVGVVRGPNLQLAEDTLLLLLYGAAYDDEPGGGRSVLDRAAERFRRPAAWEV